MPLFDADNRLRSDACATNKRDLQNLSMEEYVFRDIRAHANEHGCPSTLSTSDCKDLKARVQTGDGFGVTASSIDSESDLRFPVGGTTHTRARQSLSTRVFVASPDMGRGGLEPNIESKLLLSGDTGTSRVCAHRFAEVSYDRFDPVVTLLDVKNVVKAFPAGEPSRGDPCLQSRGSGCSQR